MMVEVFCGILAGAQYSKNVRTWKVTDRVANLVCLIFSLLLACVVVFICLCYLRDKINAAQTEGISLATSQASGLFVLGQFSVVILCAFPISPH